MFKNSETYAKIKELERQGYKIHHFAFARGYVRNDENSIRPYKGRYGTGYICDFASCHPYFVKSNHCHKIAYFLKKN